VKSHNDINGINDFVLDINISNNEADYDSYLNTFKIRPRYVFHKKEVLKLIKRRKSYSDSQLKEIADVTKSNIDQVKKDIFGEEIFNNSITSTPLTKLKRDIAREIGLI
jgi:hypothetical protein